MITLAAGNTIIANAQTSNSISAVLFGMELSGTTETYKVLATGYVPLFASAIYTCPASTAAFVKKAVFVNSAVTTQNLGVYINAVSAANLIGTLPIPAGGEVTLTEDGWKVLDGNGALVTTMSLPNQPTNTITGRISAGTGLAEFLTPAQATSMLDPATTALQGVITPAEKIELNSLDGRKSDGTVKRVFRPGDYMIGNTYDPTGTVNSTSSFSAMMTAFNALNDRAMIELSPGVFKVDPAIITGFGTAPLKVRGPSRGICVLIPNSAGDFVKLGAGSDGNSLSGFAIYNTAVAPFASGSGINTNDADSVLIEDMMFVDLFYDVSINGRPVTSTTNGTTSVTGISPVLTAADVGKPFNGVGIPTGTTISAQGGSTATLNNAATVSTTATRYVGNTIKCSIQRTLHSQSNGNANSVGIRVENGDAGDTYIGPDVVMSNTGATRRRASVELIASGHYEVTQANLTGSAQAILIDPQQSQIVAFGFHTGVLCDSCTVNGMTISAPTATSTVKNIKSVNSWYSGTVSGTGLSGVVTSGTAGGIINGVTHTCDRMLNNQRHGYEHNFGTDLRWDSCDMKGNNAANAAIGVGYDGLFVAAGVSNWSVNGGKYGGTDTLVTSPNQRYGVNVASGAGDNIKIAPDDLSGNRDGPLQLLATGVNVGASWCPGLTAGTVLTASVTVTAGQIKIGGVSVPKNSLRPGSCFRVQGGGVTTNTATTPGGTFTLRAGPTTLTGNKAAEIVFTGPTTASTLAAPFTIDGMFTVRTIGAGGTIIGYLNIIKDKANHATPAVATDILLETVAAPNATVAIDTTVNNLLELTALAPTASWIVNNLTVTPVNY